MEPRPPTPKTPRSSITPILILKTLLPLALLAIIPFQLTKTTLSKKSLSNQPTSSPTTTTTISSYDRHQSATAPPPPPPLPPLHGPLPPSSGPKCDLFSGEWVPNPDAPYYTNTSCWAIHEHQNCIKYGRPDTDFIKWRWKPDGCELPILNPNQFFEIVRGKSLAFVGDSINRNHMQSLICLLSQVEFPVDVSKTDDEHFKRWYYESYNFTMAAFWSPFLVKAQENDPNGPSGTGIFGLYLDEADEAWKAQIDEFDYVILSAEQWYFRSLMYYENQRLVGCRYCEVPNVTDHSIAFGYERAFRTALKTILERENFKGVVYLRTFVPSHFEGGEWNKGGNCLRQKPFKSSEANLEGVNLDLYMAQLKVFNQAQKLARQRGLSFRLLDMTQPMLLRPDGHPSRYGHWPDEQVTLYNDCVHWCLPGPIDNWSDFLLELMRKEKLMAKEEKIIPAKEMNLREAKSSTQRKRSRRLDEA